MKMNFVLGRIWGIPIGLHFSWLIIFGLLMFSLATGMLPSALPGLSTLAITFVALFSSLLFFSSVLAHELGHAFIALKERIPVRGISLFIFGGVAQIEKEPETAGAEFRISAAGPLVSFTLAGLFFLLSLSPLPAFITFPAVWLARINLILALFNLIPGFPLDGGRLFRAILWKITSNSFLSTRIAARTGQVVAFGFMAFGLISAFITGTFSNLWLAFIGWFLLSAASGSLAQASFQKRMSGLKVADVMRQEIPSVPSFITLRNLVQQYVLGMGYQVVYVSDGTVPEGVISLDKIAHIGQAKWSLMTTGQAMTPLSELKSVTPDTDLITALGMMEQPGLDLLPVSLNGELIGLLTKEDIYKASSMRSRLNA